MHQLPRFDYTLFCLSSLPPSPSFSLSRPLSLYYCLPSSRVHCLMHHLESRSIIPDGTGHQFLVKRSVGADDVVCNPGIPVSTARYTVVLLALLLILLPCPNVTRAVSQYPAGLVPKARVCQENGADQGLHRCRASRLQRGVRSCSASHHAALSL